MTEDIQRNTAKSEMKAVRFYGVEDVRFEMVPCPKPKDNEVLIQVLYAGICGSDLHIYKKGMFVQNIPETMGHEFVGRVVSAGEKCSRELIGKIVSANPMVPCMKCPSCMEGNYNTCHELGFIGEVRQGCFAEYIAMPCDAVFEIPCGAYSSFDEIKKYVLTEPLAVALNVCNRSACTQDDKVAIIGAGPIGLLTCAVLKKERKVKSITMVDLSTTRLEYARKVGSDFCFTNSDDLMYDYDLIIDCAGVEASIAAGVSHVKANGRVCIVSIFENPAGIDCNEIVSRQLSIIGANVYHYKDLTDAAALICRSGDYFDILITNEFKPEDCRDAFMLLSSRDKTVEKVVFNTYYQ